MRGGPKVGRNKRADCIKSVAAFDRIPPFAKLNVAIRSSLHIPEANVLNSGTSVIFAGSIRVIPASPYGLTDPIAPATKKLAAPENGGP